MGIRNNANLNMPFAHFLILLLRPEEVYKLITDFNRLVIEVVFLDNLNVFLPLRIWDGEFDPILIGVEIDVL